MALRMAHEHPMLAVLSCSECQRFVYEIPSGVAETFQGANGPEKIPRPTPPPCDRCPKGSPANEHLYRLSEKNYRTWKLRQRVKTGVYRLSPELADCPLLADNFALIDEVVADAERAANNRELAAHVAVKLAGILGRR